MQVEGAEARDRVQMAVDTTEIALQDVMSVRQFNFIPERKGNFKAEDSGWAQSALHSKPLSQGFVCPIAQLLVQVLVTTRATGRKLLAGNYCKGHAGDKSGVQA